MHLDQRCSSAINPELKKSGSFPLTNSSTAVTTSSLGVVGWCDGGVMVLGKLPVPGRPTLEYGRAKAYSLVVVRVGIV